MEPLKFDVVIVGGGLVGLAFAARLANSGLRLALVEKHTPQRQSGWDSRIYAFSPSNVQALQKLGTWSRVDPNRVASVQKMCIQGDQPQGQLAFSAYETGVESLAWIAESQQVLCALWEQIQQQANDYRTRLQTANQWVQRAQTGVTTATTVPSTGTSTGTMTANPAITSQSTTNNTTTGQTAQDVLKQMQAQNSTNSTANQPAQNANDNSSNSQSNIGSTIANSISSLFK